MTYRLGILVSHPIQYYAPWFRYLAERLELDVYYAHRQPGSGQASAGFGVEFEWDIPLLEGYRYTWLKNVAATPSVQTFAGLDTPELYEIIQPGKFDAFLLFSWNRKSSWQAIRACRRARIPVLMRGDSHLRTKRSSLKAFGKYLPYRFFLPRMDAHLYVGQLNKAYLKHYGVREERLFFSPHFVDSEFFKGRASMAVSDGTAHSIRALFEIADDAVVFLFVGKLIDVKRPQDLLQAFLKLQRSQVARQTHLIFVGDGPLRGSLERTAQEHGRYVHFAGFRNQTELPAFYQIADALVLPSAAETWGLVVNEAMACGVPCITSDGVGCSSDLIEEGVTGFTYPTGNIEELSDRMLKLINVPVALGRSEAIRTRAEKYSMQSASKGLMSALSSIAKSDGAALDQGNVATVNR